MASRRDIDQDLEGAYVSTGHLPQPDAVQALVDEAHARFRSNTEGENSRVYPALAAVPEDAFGVCVVGTTGSMFAAGDADHEFTIMSVSKPFVFAQVCELIGPAATPPLGVITALRSATNPSRATISRDGPPAREINCCPAQLVTPEASSPSEMTNNPARNGTTGSPNPANTSLELNTPAAYSAIAAPSATISGGNRFHTNSTTTAPSTTKVIALSLTALPPPVPEPGASRE